MTGMAERIVRPGFAANSDTSSLHVPEDDRASLGRRCLAYLVDSVLLFGVCMAFGAAAFLVILLGSDMGRATITDGQELGFVAFLLAAFPAWMVFNIALMSARGHTVGQYVMGLRTVGEAEVQMTPARVALYWLALHPLLFHPLLALPWALFAALGVTIANSPFLFVLALAMVLLCIVTPLVSLIYAFLDSQQRGIHDRLARVKVVQL